MSGLLSYFSYGFIWRALIGGVLISLCIALLGVNLVLRRFSMIGDGLSHVGFGALALAAVMNVAPLAVAIPLVTLASFFMLWLNERGKMNGDASIAMLSSSAYCAIRLRPQTRCGAGPPGRAVHICLGCRAALRAIRPLAARTISGVLR